MFKFLQSILYRGPSEPELQKQFYEGVVAQHQATIGVLSAENTHLKKGFESLYKESIKLGHIRKEKVQLMCMQALQVPK